jgi:hypothetical protein
LEPKKIAEKAEDNKNKNYLDKKKIAEKKAEAEQKATKKQKNKEKKRFGRK